MDPSTVDRVERGGVRTAPRGRSPRAGRALPARAIAEALEALPVAIALVDEAGAVRFANDRMRERAAEGARSRQFTDQYPDYGRALGGDLSGTRDVSAIRRCEGADVRERVAVRPTPFGCAVTVLDRFDDPAASDVAVAAQDVQATRLASLGFMVAGVCHEVGNPLAAVHSMLQILRSTQTLTPDMLERGLASISANIARVLAITRSLTDFSRIGDDPARAVRLDQAVDEALSLLRHQYDPRTLDVEVAVAPDAAVMARAGQIERVVFNILQNAAHAMGGSGRVSVASHRQGNRIELAIRDEGPGVPEAHLERVFEAFFSTKPPGSGAGLGLAISREIVHELGGELRVANREGRGACFTIALPLAGASTR